MTKQKSFTERIMEKFGYHKKGIGPMADDSRIYRSLRSYLDSVDSMEVTNPYEKSVWVFASINAIAQNISRVPFYLYTEKTKDIKTIINTGPLYDLFMNPNPYMITSTLMFATILFLELYGEAFWVFEGRKNITEIPKEIWVVDPTRFAPIIEDNKFNGYWKYTNGSLELEFAPHQILQFKYFNPYNDIRGLSPIEASMVGVEQDYFASKYNKQFFKDGISLSGIIKAPDFLTDEQYNRMKNQFEQRHAGYGNSHKVGVIEGGADFIETKSMSQRDMEFNILKNTIRGEILAAFKTNEVVLGNYTNIQSYEGIKNAHEAFWKETLLPKIIYIEDFLWAKFFSKINGGKIWGGFDISVIEALREDFGKKVELAKILNEMGYPINMINKRLDLGFEDVEWGNTWWVKVGIVPVEEASEANKPEDEPNLDPEDEPIVEPEDEPEGNPNEPEGEKPDDDLNEGKDISLSNRDDAAWARFIARHIPLEKMFKSKLKRYLYEQRKQVITNLYSGKDIFNVEEEIESLKNLFLPLYNIAKEENVSLLEEETSLSLVDSGNLGDSVIKDRLRFSSSTIVSTIDKGLRNLLLEDVSIDFKVDLVRKFYNKTDNRIPTIARTEASAIMNSLRYNLMKSNGITHHKWVSKGEKGRHKLFNGKIIRLGDSFSNSFMLRYPLDHKAPINEVINCLCMTVPVIIKKSC